MLREQFFLFNFIVSLAALLLVGFIFQADFCRAQDEFSFDLQEFEKKSLEWGGYGELKWEHADINHAGLFSRLNLSRDPGSTMNIYSATTRLDGSYTRGIAAFNWLFQAAARQDDLAWDDTVDVYEAYVSFKPAPVVSVAAGKKSYKWGKGYAWNPVGFINRPKDPDDPEEALEGYNGAEIDLIRSFSGPLQTVALTAMALPVWQGVNEDFGEINNFNLAAKLYLLYRDTDLDFMIFSGNSRSKRYGFDFSRNLASNLEIHAEFSHVPNQQLKVVAADGSIKLREIADTSFLIGTRYLSESDITTIVEFYHNDDGYSSAEMDLFYQLADTAISRFEADGSETLLRRAVYVSQSGYGRAQSGRDYLYAKVTWKEPFDFLYFTPGFTAIVNLADNSYSFSPEALYTGFINWELRLRFSVINGGHFTEFGEKTNSNKLELRARYFF